MPISVQAKQTMLKLHTCKKKTSLDCSLWLHLDRHVSLETSRKSRKMPWKVKYGTGSSLHGMQYSKRLDQINDFQKALVGSCSDVKVDMISQKLFSPDLHDIAYMALTPIMSRYSDVCHFITPSYIWLLSYCSSQILLIPSIRHVIHNILSSCSVKTVNVHPCKA